MSELNACDSCGFKLPENELKITSGAPSDNFRETLLCNVCFCTPSGNAGIYPRQYEKNGQVLKTIAWCTNQILKAIKEIK